MKLVDMNEVKQITGKSRSTIWRWIHRGSFPKPRQIGTHNIGWLEGEVDEWVTSLPLCKTYTDPNI